MIWEKTDVDSNLVRSISDKYSIDTLLASILVRRGVTTSEDIKFFIESDIRFLHNPFLFTDMEDVVDRLYMAKEEGEKVLVFGDKDVDGVTSSVILYEGLKILDLDLSIRVPVGNDGYGLSIQAVEEAYNNDISLIITVDCGISAFESIDRARELGISVIVIDHHNARDCGLPNADFIINPKVEGSGYPYDGLAACGVTSKVIWALSFSTIDTLYKSQLCFLHGELNNDSIEFSATKVCNLVAVEKLKTTDPNELIDFLKGEQILVYGQGEQKKLYRDFFGSGLEINVLDIEPEITRILKGIKGHSLKNLVNFSKMRVYSQGDFSQIDLIISLFTTYIERRYDTSFEPFFRSLDLVALGTVADMMPLKGENRILVNRGMELISKTQRPGLQHLLYVQNILGKEITSKDISWGLAPIVNSAGRMKKANIAVESLLTGEKSESIGLREGFAKELVELNKERRGISEALWNSISGELFDIYEEFSNKIVVLFNDKMPKGVTGIIASRIQAMFNVPAIVIANDEGDLSGSIRSPGNLDIKTLFNSLDDILDEWGGHNCAAGFKLKPKNLLELKNRIKKLTVSGKIIRKIKDSRDIINIDAHIPDNYLNPDIIKTVDFFEPFGEENRALKFETKNARILEINFMGKGEKKHLKLLFEIGSYKWPAIFWNSADRVGVDFTKGDSVAIAYKVERNFYGGNETLQLNILDIIK